MEPYPTRSPFTGKAPPFGFTDWDLVVKVKYGDTLRRFNAYVHQGYFDHNMANLKAKIVGLFELEFKHGAQLVLTYTDGDGDEVTLGNDDELHDAAIRQRLNPLRINVKLKPSGIVGPEKELGATNCYSLLQSLQANSTIKEAFNSIPQPLQNSLSNISHDLTSKVMSSSTAFQELLEFFSKSVLSATMQSGGESLVATPVAANCSNVNRAVNQEAVNEIMQPTEPLVLGAKEATKELENATKTQRVGDKITVSSDQNLPNFSSYSFFFGDTSTSNLKDLNLEKKNGSTARLVGGDLLDSATALESRSFQPPVSKEKTSVMPILHAPAINNDSFYSFQHSWKPAKQEIFCGTVTAPSNSGHPTAVSNIPAYVPEFNPYKIKHPNKYAGSSMRTFHAGVQCDRCGMLPIIGPRYKSNVQNNFDLCRTCFDEVGNGAEYIEMIHGRHVQYPKIAKKLNYTPLRFRHLPFPRDVIGHPSRSSKMEIIGSKFVRDVTILDGTILPPCTLFTKIWRMRNSGTDIWPFGTQLVWTSGDQLGSQISVELEISSNGCAVNGEIDVAVDFKTPSEPGRYTSFWRMAMPHGQKFGDQVWVQIQVESPPVSTGRFQEINLNLIPENTCHLGDGSEIIGVDVEPGVYLPPSVGPTEPVKPFSNEEPVLDVLSPRDETNDIIAPVQAAREVSTIHYPAIDRSEFSSDASLVASSLASIGVIDDPVEETLLLELVEMGFKNIDLNKEVLRCNKYNLELSIDDLCGISEWDPLLEELQEMGFTDKEKNAKLLQKNGGSIKRVVLDLVAGVDAE